MLFHELLHKYEWSVIWPRMKELYPESLEGSYLQAVNFLLAMEPKESPFRILVAMQQDFLEPDREFISVCGVDGSMIQDDDSWDHDNGDPEVGSRLQEFAIEHSPWEEWLGMEVDPESFCYGELAVLCHCLCELTFSGYDPGDGAKMIELIQGRIDSIDRLGSDAFVSLSESVKIHREAVAEIERAVGGEVDASL